MKTIAFKYWLMAGSLCVLAASCVKKLEEYNPSGLTSEAVYTTVPGFESLVNAAYSYQRWWYGKEEGTSLSEMGTDIWTSGSGDVYPDLTKYMNLQGSNAAISSEWNALYAGVNVCNAGVNRIGAVPYVDSVRAQREGELRFLRAFYYWHIVETWGGVNFTTQETTSAITTANKTPVDTFYAQIFRDLQFAVDNLPNTTADYGRVTKPAAMAFLARMYLTRGMNVEARDMALGVINGGFGFALEKNYGDLWLMANEKSKEVVYAVNYSTNLSLNDLYDAKLNPLGHSRGSNNEHLLFLMVYDQAPAGMTRDIANGRPFNRYMPTRYLLDLFNDADDARYDGSFQTVWVCNKAATATATQLLTLKVGDTAIYCSKSSMPGGSTDYPRNKYFVYDRDAMFNSDGSYKNNKFYVSLSKFKDPTRSSANEAQSARDVFVIRFAELYLIAAEAEFNLGHTDAAATYLNVVRTRAAKPGHEAAMQVSADQLTLSFILDERAREFAGEQIRWFDLKRTNTLLARAGSNPNTLSNIQSYHVVRPIPQAQLDAVSNPGEFLQNQGYQ